MVAIGYGICFLFSALMAVYTVQKGYDNVDSHFWTILVLIPLVNMSYWLQAQMSSLEASVALFYFINLGTTIMVAIALFIVLRDIGLRVNPWLSVAVYGAAFAQLFIIWQLVQDNLADDMVRVISTGTEQIVRVSGGTFWFTHLAYLLAIAIVVIGGIAILRSANKTYSRRTLGVYVALAATGVIVYTVESVMVRDFSLLPYLYATASAAIAFNYVSVHAHNIASLVSDQKQHHAVRGYVAIGLDGRFLSCNEKSYELIPELRTQRIDMPFPEGSEIGAFLYRLIDRFKDGRATSAKYHSGEMICACEISHFSLRQDDSAQGYLIDIRDATQEERNLEILSNYNETLNQEVTEKTAHIQQIQRKIVLGMADMVENRDGNTGGHIKRTSDVIQILVQEIVAHGYIRLDDVLARDIVRAAPMHDLGKVSIDSSILNKPGRLTDEEYEIMKSHSAMSGDMVMILLDGVEEDHFVKTAFNVARYHHERWDGKGYPDGLVGETIPLEARIMAVADVYDALVSERVYKKPYSFERAYEIMCEGMGTQFDPNMRAVFLGCRTKLEQYYSSASRVPTRGSELSA